jgi:hypothetical protein
MIQKFINMVLDTTPRQWLIFWAETFQFNYKDPVGQLKDNLKSFYSLKGATLAVSIVVHILLIFSIQSQKMTDDSIANEGGETITLADKKDLTALMAQQDLLATSGVYYFNGTEKKITAPPLKASKSALAALLKKLGSGKNNWKATANQFGIPSADASVPTNKKDLDSKFSWSAAVEKHPKKESTGKVEEELTKQIAKYDTQFQGCYEKALLKDSSMNGKIEFLMKVGGQNNISESQVRFEGVGMHAGKSQLEACLHEVAGKIRLADNSRELVGKKIKFYVMLKAW